jgi:hypothetical protein
VNIFRSILALAALAAVFPAAAQEPTSYRVELIVIQRLKDVGTPEITIAPEVYSDDVIDTSAPDPLSVSSELDGLGEPVTGNMPVSEAEMITLSDTAARLARSAGYRVIHQAAWIQPGLPRNAAPGVPVSGTTVSGETRLYRQRYLHLGLDLRFAADQKLTEWRRMRSNEVHYYDHPLFGAIAVVVPVGNGG